MHIVSQIDPDLVARARRKQSEVWERVVATIGGEWERGWSRSWTVEPEIVLEDVMEDLGYGRD
jgi:hypothetical protein